jgi:hypothetical protein
LCVQEKPAFIFCVEDRALFCRDCDEPIHVPGTLSGNHQRYLATGIRVDFGAHDADHHAPHKAAAEQQAPSSQTTTTEVQQVPSPPEFLPQGWAVDELLQLSDYETGDKVINEARPNYWCWPLSENLHISPISRCSCFLLFVYLQMQKESPLGFKELDWFADIDLFQDQAPKAARVAAEVPELFGSQAPNDAAYYRPSKPTAGVRQSKKARIEVPDDEDDYFIVPDLG